MCSGIGPVAVVVCLVACTAFAQTTTFTYQGRLTDAGNPANGNFDLQFKLFDTPTVGTGTQAGATLVRNPVVVNAGVFTVQLDFGANVFSGADRFLEIGVRPAGSGNAYTILAPRQPITSAPYAIQTLNAQQLGGLPASSFVQNTTTPQAGANLNIGGNATMGSLNVNGPVSLGGVGAPAVAPAGQTRLYFDTASNKLRVSENGGAFVNLVGATGVGGSGTANTIPLWSAGTTLGNSIISQSGNNVGIGTTNPVAKLGVSTLTTSSANNTAYFEAPNIGPNASNIHFGTTGDWYIRSAAAAGKVILQDTGGNVGIGTTNPTAAKLQVQNSAGTAIYGVSTSNCGGIIACGAGVYGENTNGNGFGVYGRNGFGGFAMFAEGHAGQSRNKGGWVKAMLKVTYAGGIERCYNGITGSVGGNCGFSVTQLADAQYQYNINFGFKVDDRFASVIPDQGPLATQTYYGSIIYGNGNENNITVITNVSNVGFTIIVY